MHRQLLQDEFSIFQLRTVMYKDERLGSFMLRKGNEWKGIPHIFSRAVFEKPLSITF
jgi:hypothetical protein